MAITTLMDSPLDAAMKRVEIDSVDEYVIPRSLMFDVVDELHQRWQRRQDRFVFMLCNGFVAFIERIALPRGALAPKSWTSIGTSLTT